MDLKLKQRLIGALVLGALAVIFVPMIVLGPEPEGAAEAAGVPIEPPPAPEGDFITREIPLNAGPLPTPAAGAAVTVPADPDTLPMVDATASVAPRVDALEAAMGTAAVPAATPPAPVAAAPAATPPAPVTAPATISRPAATPALAAAPVAAPPPLPVATAAGGFRVIAGSFTQRSNADALVARLRSGGLTASTEPTQVNGQPATRVVLGPFADRASAEAVRVRAAAIAGSASVVAADAAAATAARPATATAGADAVGAGFAVQLGAFGSEADARALVARARAAGFTAFEQRIPTANGVLWRVRLGPASDRAAAERLKSDAANRLGIAGIVVPHP
ncbi:SPOR domain-containing protein [Silanimonas sp.]|uniref:SPOR domain-containing protein n=1 Tax=Silanimonas sp. TaxID=1929290 RepID=UPI001BC15595|nr:SPOR domain-containing protein [Silanimonas sp.]MBS3895678.1 SPOR domain-containing protein [Silanimonas sp.]MBS3924403.1 SPOR domain-containing protein [Xanthomonadaceae bacterium]